MHWGNTTQNMLAAAAEDLGGGDVLEHIYNLDRTATTNALKNSQNKIRIRTIEFTSRISQQITESYSIRNF
jgi:hypothetical protein